jgi:hypothetical protein
VHVDDAAVAEGREARARVRAGADEEDARGRPVGDAALGEVEREADHGPAGALQARAGLDAAGRVGRGLEEALEARARGAARAGALEGPADLAGDLALADDHGLEPGGDGEQVLGDRVAALDVDAAADVVAGDPAGAADHVDRGLDGQRAGGGEGLLDVEVGLEAVAGGEDDGPRDEVVLLHERAGDGGCGHGQLLEDLEAGVVMTRRQTYEHTPW